MAHDHHDAHALPPIPFTTADEDAMRNEDVRAAKAVAWLASCIFLFGLVLYIAVLVSVIIYEPVYAIR